VNVTQVIHVPDNGDLALARVLCPKCKLVQPLSVVSVRYDVCVEDVQCEECGHEWAVEWPD